jgi:putative thioredoxin
MSKYIKAVTADNFETEVIVKSKTKPILVDFWAEWCEPCKHLTPALHAVIKDLNGDVLLATIDTDKEQELAIQYGIRSLPTVLFVIDGEIVEQFSGLQSTASIKKIIAPHLEKIEQAQVVASSEEVKKAMELIAEDKVTEAIPVLKNDFTVQGRLMLIKIYLQQGDIEEALNIYNNLEDWQKKEREAEVLKGILELALIIPKTDNTELKDAIEFTVSQDPATGVQKMLAMLAEAEDEQQAEIKKSLVIAFGLFDDPKEATQYRRKMASIIF